MTYNSTFPFRLGCTSYVLPDEILPNIQYMAPRVDDIELILFESLNGSNFPEKSTLVSLQQIADQHDITYSVHFPIDVRAGAKNADERKRMLRQVIDSITMTETLPISGYLLHLEGLDDETSVDEVSRWSRVTDEFCHQLVQTLSIDPQMICIENLGYSPSLHQHHVEKYHFSHCIDIGHLWVYGYDWSTHVRQVLKRTRIIHLHGVNEGNDHRALTTHSEQKQLQEFVSMLQTFSGVVTLEVFGENDTFLSLNYFEELWRRLH